MLNFFIPFWPGALFCISMDWATVGCPSIEALLWENCLPRVIELVWNFLSLDYSCKSKGFQHLFENAIHSYWVAFENWIIWLKCLVILQGEVVWSWGFSCLHGFESWNGLWRFACPWSPWFGKRYLVCQSGLGVRGLSLVFGPWFSQKQLAMSFEVCRFSLG